MLKIFFCNEQYEMEITERKAILYGVCHNAMLISERLGIQKYEYVMDSDPGKWGHFVRISGKLCKIVSPDILVELIAENFYICTFTERNNDKIKKYIQDRFKKDFLIIDNPNQFSFGYESLKELFEKDIYTISKCIELNLVREIQNLISQIDEALECIGKLPYCYVPIKKGKKILVKAICGIDEALTIAVLSRSGKIPYPKSWYGRAVDVRNDEYEFIAYQKDIGLSSDITYYSKYEKGLLIQKYCSQNVNFRSNEVIHKILNEARRIHDIDLTVPIYTYPFKRFSSLFLGLDKGYQEKLAEIKQALQKYENDFLECKLVLSHGDLHPGNIVFDMGNPVFIDWELICMTYEWYDVCRFLFYNKIDEFSSDVEQYETIIVKLYEDIGELLHYYDNVISTVQILEAKKILFLCEAVELCLRLNRHQECTEQLITKIEKHISLIER